MVRVNYYWQWDFLPKGTWNDVEPKNWEWVKDTNTPFDCYIDLGAYNVKNDGRKKIFVALESDGHYSELHNWIKQNYSIFNYIFTFDKELLKLPNALPMICGGLWYIGDVMPDDKTKLISFCCSNKRIVPSHLKRLELANMIHDKVDMYGNYFGKYNMPVEFLRDYKYNIVFECENTDLYFTEKLLNCFASRTVPINYGCTNLEKFGFDTRGVIQINNIYEIVNLLNSNFDWNKFYDNPNVREAIEHNYNLSFKYARFEDYILETYPEVFKELCS